MISRCLEPLPTIIVIRFLAPFAPPFSEGASGNASRFYSSRAIFCRSSWETDTLKVPRVLVEGLTDAVCYAALMARVERRSVLGSSIQDLT